MVKEEVSDIECSGDDGERDSPRPGQGRGEEGEKHKPLREYYQSHHIEILVFLHVV